MDGFNIKRTAGQHTNGADASLIGNGARLIRNVSLAPLINMLNVAKKGTGVIELKPVDLADAEIIFRAWGRHPENFAYLTARVFSGVSDARRYLKDLFPTPESRAFHIVDPANGVIGIVKAAIHEPRAQIGYVVHKPFWGKGVATSAVRQVTEIIETLPNISRMWATCAIQNPASERVLEKCGFQREAVLKNWVIYPAQGNRPFDNYSYVRIPKSAG